MKKIPIKKDDISIVLTGAAGQGVQTVEQLLTHLFKISGYHLFATKEYMSRVRGGTNSTEIRAASNRVRSYVERIDILFPLNRESLKHVEHRITSDTIILGEHDKLIVGNECSDCSIIDIPLSAIAEEIGGSIFTNIIATGVIAALFSIGKDDIHDYLGKRFGRKGDDIVSKNITAVDRGYEIGTELIQSGTISVELEKNADKNEVIISGGEAVGMGAIAGGCDFISSYPMTPSTPVLTFLANHSNRFGIIAEQAEDEIAAVNMAVGAWYAGSRALVTTSGGGFTLMTEGVSLAGIIESPLVVHLAQRPGPATGLPTRTEQGDLDLVLYAGHGEFPRIIFAASTLEDAFTLSREAFNLADKYQVPVFILTDQYFIDSYYNTPAPVIDSVTTECHVIKTTSEYKRYAVTESGISPRGIPGHGDGLVLVDSDEHDEHGHITEDHDVRMTMMDKRLGKFDAILEGSLPPYIDGPKNADTMIVSWGSTYPIIKEAIGMLDTANITHIHYSQVFPLHPDTEDILSGARNIILIEGNATAQFTRLLKLYADIDPNVVITKYNGLAFSVEELAERLKSCI